MTLPIRGLTLIRPWAWCVAQGHKPVENRTWKPPDFLRGGYLAIHAGKKYDAEAAQDIAETFGLSVPDEATDTTGAIVAVARLAAVVQEGSGDPRCDDRWFCGPFGWWLEDVRAIEPVPCKGAQGLWPVPADVLHQVRERWRRAGLGGER